MAGYREMRNRMLTGDVIGVEARGFVSTAIRVLTGQQLNHVAMIVRMEEDTIFVFEYVEGTGFQLSPASNWIDQRLRKGNVVYFIQAPENVRTRAGMLRRAVIKIRDGKKRQQRYGYWELPLVWFAQIFKINIPQLSRVCSTSIGMLWAMAGYEWKKTPDPGDFLAAGDHSTPIKSM